MKRKILFFTLFLNCALLSAQEEITAKIIIDEYSNLQVNQIFNQNTKSIYSFPKEISLNPKEAIFLKEKGIFKECEIQNVNNIKFEIVTDKSSITNDFFISDLRYLGVKNDELYKLKKINLDISSNKYKIMFPTQEDLKRNYVRSPKIIAGNFNFFEENGFKVFYLENEKEYLDEMKKANIGMNNSFNYYSKYFGEKSKPRIAFAPLNKPSITNENIIVYDSNVIKGKNRENSISHEIAHIWFGQDGLIIKERPLTEGIAEFLSMQYVISQLGEKQLDKSINERLFNLEGQTSLEALKKNNLDANSTHLLSYDLLPIYFQTRLLNNPNFINELGELYKNNVVKKLIDLNEINIFFKSKGVETISTDEVFPDFFISECSSSEVCITSNSEKNYAVEIGIVDSNNQKSLKTLTFSKEQKVQKINIENNSKIVIDPSYKILQTSRLNDIWSKDENNVFNRNRYFKINSKEDIAFISNEVANYLSRKSENISDKIIKSYQVENKLKDLRSNNSKKLLSGGATSYVEKKNSLFLYFSFNNENTNETTVLKIILKLDSERKSILDIKCEE
ncbi:hypothetical protein [Flavobacterium macrobrachii]|uniref:Peptidase M1 membrane alanine aminopeptidase domain-containing protein n=1 Tax=Flavobacterium macrobrachii TaxID=591204 RepID=A0ABS2CSN1_9FLAO|nr:hypothetical protein [Flavobacterium macrobrachii]MBM6497978.1 hypothetical protein [Flavobacterium macrobrachii]